MFNILKWLLNHITHISTSVIQYFPGETASIAISNLFRAPSCYCSLIKHSFADASLAALPPRNAQSLVIPSFLHCNHTGSSSIIFLFQNYFLSCTILWWLNKSLQSNSTSFIQITISFKGTTYISFVVISYSQRSLLRLQYQL